jgi:hypothetical protein
MKGTSFPVFTFDVWNTQGGLVLGADTRATEGPIVSVL